MSDDVINDDMSFEYSLDELESLVDKLERGQLTLDQSLETFERGMRLARVCNKKLSEAQRKIEILVEDEGRLRVEDLTERDV